VNACHVYGVILDRQAAQQGLDVNRARLPVGFISAFHTHKKLHRSDGGDRSIIAA
jgi:hypothetical protein